MKKLYKLLNNEIFFGNEIKEDEHQVTVEKPFSIYKTPTGQVTLAPYDAQVIQDEMDIIYVQKSHILYSSQMPNNIDEAYTSAISNIIIPESNIIV